MSKHLFKENKFGIRKFAIGTASIAIGATFYLGMPHHDVHAAEQTPQDQMSSTTQINNHTSQNTEQVKHSTAGATDDTVQRDVNQELDQQQTPSQNTQNTSQQSNQTTEQTQAASSQTQPTEKTASHTQVQSNVNEQNQQSTQVTPSTSDISNVTNRHIQTYATQSQSAQNTSVSNNHQVATPKVSANDYEIREGEYFNPVKDMNVQVNGGDNQAAYHVNTNSYYNTNRAGTYPIKFTASNKDGAQGSTTRNLKVREAGSNPTIYAPDKTINVGQKYDVLQDVTAHDKEDGQLTNRIYVTNDNNYNSNKAGIYNVNYKVSDKNGHTTPASRTITVVNNVSHPTKEQVIQKRTFTTKYQTETRQNPNQPEGYKKVIQNGQDGQQQVTEYAPVKNGKVIGASRFETKDIQPLKNKIIEVGTGQLTQQTTQTEESVAFGKKEVKNPKLPIGETKVVQNGKNGKVQVTTKQSYVNGKAYGQPKISRKMIEKPVDEIVQIGTKEAPDKQPSEPSQPKQVIDNSKYDAIAGSISMGKKDKISEKDFTNAIHIPNYPSDKGYPLITVDHPEQIPDGHKIGDHGVAVTVKYSDGSEDHVIVTVHVLNMDYQAAQPHDDTHVNNNNDDVITPSNHHSTTTPDKNSDNNNTLNQSTHHKNDIAQNYMNRHDGLSNDVTIDHASPKTQSNSADQSTQNYSQQTQENTLPNTGNDSHHESLLGTAFASLFAGLGLTSIVRRRKSNKQG